MPGILGLASSMKIVAASGGLDGTESDGTQLLNPALSGLAAISGSITTSGFTDPAGGTTAGSFIENSSNDRHIMYITFSASASTDYKISFYVKPASGTRYLMLSLWDTYIICNPANGAITDNGILPGNSSTYITSTSEQGANGFWKFTAAMNSQSNTGTSYWVAALCQHSTLATFSSSVFGNEGYTGDGTSGIYIFRHKASTYP